MRLTRLLAGLLGLALVGLLTVAVATPAEAVARPVPIKGVSSKGKFYIRGDVGVDLAKQTIRVERQIRPGAKWKTWKKDKVNKKGIYRVRVFRDPSSKATCYRVKVKPFGGFEKGKSKPICVVRVGG